MTKLNHSQANRGSPVRGALMMAAALSLVACASGPRPAPPVEDRSVRGAAPAPLPPSAPVAAAPANGSGATPATVPLVDATLLPGAENAGKPGYYTVRAGDTLMRVGLETGQNWRDIARWNGIGSANTIEIGQVLRVVPPGPDVAAPVATRPVTSPRVESRPLDVRGSSPPPAAPAGASANPAAPATATATPVEAAAAAASAAAPAPAAVPSTTPAPPAAKDEDNPGWAWPASGPVIGQYDEARTKGVVIGGKAGDAVLAAADGRVVYAGSGLRGYGNLVIVKHNPTYLTAYAHNRTLLVKEDQPVRRGQQIAEMGSTEAGRVQLHFEIRKLGKPIDPTLLLPPR